MTQALTFSRDASRPRTRRHTVSARAVVVKIKVCLNTWATRRRTRLALKQLEPWQLEDVGLTHAQAETEAARVFWKA